MLTEPVVILEDTNEKPYLQSRDPKGGLKVRVPLGPAVDQPWAAFAVLPVTQYYEARSIKGRNLAIVGGHFEYTTSEVNYQNALDDVRQRVEGTNRYYFHEFVPRQQAQIDASRNAKQSDDAELERLRTKFKGK